MVQGYSKKDNTCSSIGSSSHRERLCRSTGTGSGPHPFNRFSSPSECRASYIVGYPYEQWCAHQPKESKLRRFEKAGRETGGFMLNITGLNRFFFIRDFHDMRCKYEKVLSIIHQQLNREPEDGDVFIVMSKDLSLVRLFSYDRRSYSMFEKRFRSGYKFLHVTYSGDEKIYSINW